MQGSLTPGLGCTGLGFRGLGVGVRVWGFGGLGKACSTSGHVVRTSSGQVFMLAAALSH